MKHRVGYCTDTHGVGGAEQSMLHLLGGLDRGAWEPTLVCHPHPDLELLVERARAGGVPVVGLPQRLDSWRSISRFAARLRELRPAVFHAHLTWPMACQGGILAAVLARTPAIVTTVHLFVELPYGLRARLRHRLLGVGVHRHVAVSKALGQRLHARFKVPAPKIRVVPNGIPLQSFAGKEARGLRARLGLPLQRPLVLMVGRLVAQKGQQDLLEAATRIPAAHFVLVGEGPDRELLQDKTRSLGLQERVTFLGQRADVAELLSLCDLFVLPSLFEGLPLSILEALAAARPVVATNVGGNSEVITDGETGLLVPPADPSALARALLRLLADEDLAQRLATLGQALVGRTYSVQAMVRGVTVVFEELLR